MNPLLATDHAHKLLVQEIMAIERGHLTDPKATLAQLEMMSLADLARLREDLLEQYEN